MGRRPGRRESEVVATRRQAIIVALVANLASPRSGVRACAVSTDQCNELLVFTVDTVDVDAAAAAAGDCNTADAVQKRRQQQRV
jgi:hypothetical protein